MLADRAGVARKTVAHFEIGRRALLARTRRDITETFERAGLEFVWSPSSGDGVRFAPRPQALQSAREGRIESP